MRTRTVWRLAVAALAALGFCAGQARAADQAPKIQFAEVAHEFGKSAPNQELKHSFTFKNTGTGLLVIEDVKAG